MKRLIATRLARTADSAANSILQLSIHSGYLRRAVIGAAQHYLATRFATTTSFRITSPHRAMEDKALLTGALLRVVDRGLTLGLLSQNYAKRFLRAFGGVFTQGHDVRASFRQRYRTDPPGFTTIAPTHRCNLRCEGCYAVSSPGVSAQLGFDTFSRIVREQRELWGSHFTVVTGGEPFVYRDRGKGLLDLCAENPSTFFLVYTNGTMIDKNVARRIAELGNITPAISIEGYEKETDQRRGKGVYERILKAAQYLRDAKTPFGISVTATRKNVQVLLSDEFWDYYFDELGVLYAWMFQYMPIGRAYTLELMLSPEERMALYHANWRQIRKKGRFIADFWNCGTAVGGCISAGGNSGYIYIDWNGKVTPCAFNPYGMDNINEVYAEGGDLDTVLFSPYMLGVRKWQRDYVHDPGSNQMGNILACCPYRDHHDTLCELIRETGAKPEDEAAAEAWADEEYHQGLINYGKRFRELSGETWHRLYLQDRRETEGGRRRRVHSVYSRLSQKLAEVLRKR